MQLLTLFFALTAFRVPFGFQQASSPLDADCQALDNKLTEHPTWYEDLVNPVTLSEADIAVRVELYRPVHECLTSADTDNDLDALRVGFGTALVILAAYCIFRLMPDLPFVDRDDPVGVDGGGCAQAEMEIN